MAGKNSSLVRRLIPYSIKRESRYFLMRLLNIPYSRVDLSLDILKWLTKSSPITFFDIGANIGAFTRKIRDEYQIQQGILIEPVSELIPLLTKEFPENKGFHIVNAALSDIISETDFYINEDDNSVSSLLRINNKGEAAEGLNFDDPIITKIKTLTLDSIVSEMGITKIDLIKIDVQGAEHLVLSGAGESLKKTMFVYTEVSFRPVYEGSSTFSDLYNILYKNDFALVSISPGYALSNGELLQGDALFINKRLLN